MKKQIMNYWDVFSICKLYNNMLLVIQGKNNFNKVLYDTICEELTKSYLKQIFNII